jgi:phage protein D
MTACPQSRTPRLRLLVNGRQVDGVLEAEVVSNSYYSADCFRTSIALGADSWANGCYWSSVTGVTVNLQFSLDGNGPCETAIEGFADRIALDVVGGSVQLSGRDFTASLIEAPIQETFSNRTASEIATIFALRHGLLPLVYPTTQPVGRFYQGDHESITLDRFSRSATEWDVLVYLARQEGFDVFVQGRALYFRPAPDLSACDLVLRPADLTSLHLARSLNLARTIQVTVRSWNSLQQSAFSETMIGSLESTPEAIDQTPLEYTVVRPNLTPEMALSMASQHLHEITRHERIVDFTMPGELSLTPRSTVLLDGTNSAFDQRYFVDRIERRLDLRSGFTQRVRACNSSPRLETALAAQG